MEQQASRQRGPGKPFPKGVSGNLKGRSLPKIEVAAERDRLLASLGRDPTVVDTILIETIAALTVAQGKNPTAETARVLLRALDPLNADAKPAKTRPRTTLRERLGLSELPDDQVGIARTASEPASVVAPIDAHAPAAHQSGPRR
jgi:hypothetical protein